VDNLMKGVALIKPVFSVAVIRCILEPSVLTIDNKGHQSIRDLDINIMTGTTLTHSTIPLILHSISVVGVKKHTIKMQEMTSIQTTSALTKHCGKRPLEGA
jgi:hypothetical protein